MGTVVDGKTILSEVVTHLKYARFKPEENRRESWDEICDRVEIMHAKRWPRLREKIAEAVASVRSKNVLPSMRCAQFAGIAAETKNNRVYNCAYAPIVDVEALGEMFYNLLCGTGTGYSVQHRHVSQLPHIKKRSAEAYDYVVEDTIEGWCDATVALMDSFFEGGARPVFRLHKIRPEGSPLKTSGGRAPGPKPLKKALANIENLLSTCLDTKHFFKLRPIHVHDICCFVADAVHAGGIRRAAMIAFFDRTDIEMLECKSGDWWRDNPQRGRANNSAVFVRGEVTREEYERFYYFVRTNGTGEPGIYWTNDPDVLSNPCVEISLNPFQFCNLSTVNGLTCKNERDFFHRVRMAARLGTLQAAYTDFSYLRPRWKNQTEAEALIGVSITGIGGGIVQNYNLKRAAQIVKEENAAMAKLLGIKPAARTCCLKPEGTGSAIVKTPSGIHAWEAEMYFRSLRIGKTEPIYNYLLETIPGLIEDCVEKPEDMAIMRVPIKANKGGILKTEETAIQLLERVRFFNENWVKPGHRSGVNTHNISCTVSVKEHEWDAVQQWKWDNRDHYNGIAAFPFWGGTHRQLPFLACTEEEYNEGLSHLRKLDLREVVEYEDNTKIAESVACAGGSCAII